LFFAVTPPKLTTGPEQTRQIAEVTLARLRSVGIDGLVLYDIDDESDRNPNERPFPFLPTMDPAEYLARDLVGLDVPAIVYRAVSKHAEDGLRLWLRDQDPARALSVFVGASSREKAVATSLSRASELRTEGRPDLPPGLHLAGGTASFSPQLREEFEMNARRLPADAGSDAVEAAQMRRSEWQLRQRFYVVQLGFELRHQGELVRCGQNRAVDLQGCRFETDLWLRANALQHAMQSLLTWRQRARHDPTEIGQVSVAYSFQPMQRMPMTGDHDVMIGEQKLFLDVGSPIRPPEHAVQEVKLAGAQLVPQIFVMTIDDSYAGCWISACKFPDRIR